MNEDNDAADVVGSRLAQPPAGSPLPVPMDAGDIAIVGQNVAHAILALPEIADSSVPPLVQFRGVTSIMNQPIDTNPYTELLRDRLLLLTREKLRFVERTLPAYVPPTRKHHQESSIPSNTGGNPDFEILAEMRGHVDADLYKIQVEFVDLRSSQVLFNGLYRIHPEAEPEVESAPEEVSNPAPASAMGEPPTAIPAPSGDLTTPTTATPPNGND